MDPGSVAALLQTMAEQQENARQQNAALGNLIGQLQAGQQGQNELLARLVAGQNQPNPTASGIHHNTESTRRRTGQLVDPRGVGKPGTLTGSIAENASQFKTWRIKYANWILAAFPESHGIMRILEEQTTNEITPDGFMNMVDEHPELPDLSAQLRVTLISMTEEEPFSIVTKTPSGAHGGLEAYRRLNNRYDPTGPRSAKMVLKRMLSVKAVPIKHLRNSIEELEKLFDEYEGRSGHSLQEDLKMQCLEQLLDERLSLHIDLNAGLFPTYGALRAEVWRFAERQAQVETGPSPMEIGAVLEKGKPGPGKTQVTCFNCGKQGHRAAECWAPRQNPAEKGKRPAKGAEKGGKKGKHPVQGKSPSGPKGGKEPKGKGKGKPIKGRGRGKGIYSLEETGYEDVPEENWPGDEEPYAELGSLFVLEGVESSRENSPDGNREEKCTRKISSLAPHRSEQIEKCRETNVNFPVAISELISFGIKHRLLCHPDASGDRPARTSMPGPRKQVPSSRGSVAPLMLDAHTQTAETRIRSSDNPCTWGRREREGLVLFKRQPSRRRSTSRNRTRSRRRPQTSSSSSRRSESEPPAKKPKRRSEDKLDKDARKQAQVDEEKLDKNVRKQAQVNEDKSDKNARKQARVYEDKLRRSCTRRPRTSSGTSRTRTTPSRRRPRTRSRRPARRRRRSQRRGRKNP